ncbi:MAG: hypothetical protein L0J77_13785 [Marinobacter sp.]|nr:hypothetical protein [Marinobacter sp.]
MSGKLLGWVVFRVTERITQKFLMLLVSSKKGGRLVIALDVGLTGYKIYEACSVGRAEKCEQVGLTESVRLAGAVAGGTAGGVIAPLLCVVVGIGAAGIGGVACGIIAAGVGSVVGGNVVGDLGASAGQLIYEVRSRE